MARVRIAKPTHIGDPIIREIFDWVTQMEGRVPNHFYVEMIFRVFQGQVGYATEVLWQMGEPAGGNSACWHCISKANGCPYAASNYCRIFTEGQREAY
jgi:hypothetical protein